jgi:hypothetical protein
LGAWSKNALILKTSTYYIDSITERTGIIKPVILILKNTTANHFRKAADN